MLTIKKNILNDYNRRQLRSWVLDNKYLREFNGTTLSYDTSRLAFAVTYKISDLPERLHFFKEEDINLYNIIAIVTYRSGDIPEHVDDDLTCYMRDVSLIPEMFIKDPLTTSVYYVDMCNSMTGGETIFRDKTITPEVNSMLSFPSNKPHSVSAINGASRPRVVIVCEKYKLLKSALKLIETPLYRPG